jgi:hypothetical protein
MIEARIHPFRGEAAPLPDAATGERYLKAFWMVEHTRHAAADRAVVEGFETLGPAREVAVEAAMLTILDYSNRRGLVIKEAQGGANDRYYPVDAWFITRWLAAGGVGFALRVLAAVPAWACLEVGHLGIFHVLRKVIAVADDDARDEALRIRADAPLFLRAALAFAYPDEPWAADDLRAAAPKRKTAHLGPVTWSLATTHIDEALLPAILDSMARDKWPFVTDTALYGYTLVHRLGPAAAPHLHRYLGATKDRYAKEHFRAALALVE